MNAEEPVDLAKMAVAAMLLALLLGIAVTFFYFLYSNLSAKQSTTKDIIQATSLEKFYALEQQTQTADGGAGEYPLVSSVVNAFTELDSADVMYYDIYSKNSTVRKCFVLDNDTVSYMGLPADAIRTQVMTTDVSKYLMTFVGQRCALEIIDLSNGLFAIRVYMLG